MKNKNLKSKAINIVFLQEYIYNRHIYRGNKKYINEKLSKTKKSKNNDDIITTTTDEGGAIVSQDKILKKLREK